MEFKKYKLGELASVDISGVDKKSKEGEKPVRLCNFTDVYKNWAITKYHYSSFMKATAKDRDIEKFSIHKGQVAITKDSETRDDIGIPTYIADNFEDVVLGYHCALITPNEKLDGKYLNAYLNSKMAKKYFEGYASGSGQRYTLTLDSINDIQIWLPDITNQKKLAQVLSDIDQKIALNTRMNAELEAMAKQLYDYWFVQFDFPDENGNPYKSFGGEMVYNSTLKREIPAGWEVKPLNDLLLLEDSRRIPLSNKERENRRGIYPYYGATGIMDYIDDYIFDGDYILLAEDGSTSDKNGNPVVQYIWGKNWVNNHAHIIHASDDSQLQFYYFLLKTIPVVLIETGSIQKKISQENLLAYSVACPPKRLIGDYCSISSSFREKQKELTDENNYLTHIRDSLLPMLMNGQVIVE